MKKFFAYSLIFAKVIITDYLYSQGIGINVTGSAPDNSALLDVDASGLPTNGKKGMLIPRVALTSDIDVTTIPAPSHALLVYNTNQGMVNGNGEGFYYWDSNFGKWVYILVAKNSPGSSGDILMSMGPGQMPQWGSLNVGDNTGANISQFSTIKGIMSWVDCYSTCRNATDGGFMDWRMPTADEYYWARATGIITPPGGWGSGYVWTSSPNPTASGKGLIFDEASGNWSNSYTIPMVYGCRCVR
ncbi:MAG: hypothetical protein QXU40_03090 [Candidatus Pacearchaeota archaeon]